LSCGIYKITNNINSKSYIGLSKNIEKRWLAHKYNYRHNINDTVLCKAFNKYGIDNFNFSILELCDKNRLSEREIYWIVKYDSYNHGYNSTTGGEVGYNKVVMPDIIRCELIMDDMYYYPSKMAFYRIEGLTFEQTKLKKYKEYCGNVRYFNNANENDNCLKKEYFRDELEEFKDFVLNKTNWYDNISNEWEKEDIIKDNIDGKLTEKEIALDMGYDDIEYAYEQMYGW
jgi:hypothetical protein